MKTKNWIKVVIPITILVILGIFFLALKPKPKEYVDLWGVRSIDTMKYSRDMAEAQLNDPNFDQVMESQIRAISQTGANYVVVASPYDQKYVPFIERWVRIARSHGLHVWFRGNFSGWEGWFGSPKIDRETHLKLLQDFITQNPTLFEDEDIFTPCPECENGGPGDPRNTKDISGFRDFLKNEYEVSQHSFGQINKKVKTGYFSMNYDVAKLIMDQKTAESLGGVVVIDHYTATKDQLLADLRTIHSQTNALVMLGEFGAPIPDIHGQQTSSEQANWIDQAFDKISSEQYLIGVNYWTSFGGTTALWRDTGTPKPAVSVLTKYFTKKIQKDTP